MASKTFSILKAPDDEKMLFSSFLDLKDEASILFLSFGLSNIFQSTFYSTHLQSFEWSLNFSNTSQTVNIKEI